jgi:hypothetical protein
MSKIDFSIFTVHGLFWGSFGVTRMILRMRDRHEGRSAESGPTAREETTAPYSRALVTFHSLAFAAMYFGLFQAIVPGRVPEWFPGQRLVGMLVIATGAALMSWSLVYFRSWRFRATLDEGHLLPPAAFALLRHPIIWD